MANLSDAFGQIEVKNVGKEFLEFITKVQEPDEVYYRLCEQENLENVKPDKDNNVKFEFSTFGRWSYLSNAEGYLRGDWMNEPKDKIPYEKFMKAFREKNGSVLITYTDSDTGMDWMGSGTIHMFVDKKGEVKFTEGFYDEPVTIQSYARLYDLNEYDAVESLYGDEVTTAYDNYVDEWHKEHEYKPGESEPAGIAEWYYNDYELEQ